jgi:hypothetical protein
LQFLQQRKAASTRWRWPGKQLDIIIEIQLSFVY